MILVLGEILFDLFPAYKRIGGAPFNFAFHLKHLGFNVRFISRVGDDDLGNEILAFLNTHEFNTEDIQTDPVHPTGTVTVAPDGSGGSHSFCIAKGTAYDHIQFDQSLRDLCTSTPALVYFGTLIQRTRNGRDLIRNCLASAGPASCIFCDLNLRPECYTPESVNKTVAAADILKLSQEELDVVAPDLKIPLKSRAAGLITETGPDLVILTRGEQGSIWATRRHIREHPVPDDSEVDIADTVGAGDAYAAMSAAGRMAGLSDQKTMGLAREFAGRICGIKGALPPDPSFYTEFLSRLSHEK
ncbi:MAG: PfkB family carbohydrate kinase [Desulfobacterales bacterium]|nr:PfkB family carbohydrate kinase [Desulfobacterales bacterium]